MISKRCAPIIFKPRNTYLVRGTDLFSLRLSNIKMTTANTTAVGVNESKSYLFFVKSAKISLCVPGDEDDRKWLLYNHFV